jgi:hypothetical protein
MPEQSISLSESVSLSEEPVEPNASGDEFVVTCPPFPETFSALNLDNMKCRPFLERAELMQAQRMPGPRIDPMKYRSHEVPMTAPQPNPEDLVYLQGMPSPDRGQTFHWPHEQRERPSGD